VAGLDPGVVAAVEQADVVDAAVAEDQRRTARGDLPGPASRPLLVGVAFRIAAVEDHRGVVGDAERAQRRLELFGRAAVPVDRVLELVRVEVERAREVVLRVLLGHAEVDVEEEVPAGRRGLGPTAVEQLLEPVGVHELLVVRQGLDRKGLVGRPLRPAGRVRANARVTQLGQRRPEGRDVLGIAVQHDLSAEDDVLRLEQAIDLGVVDACEPRARERDGSLDVTSASFPVRAPAVVGRQPPDIDDRQSVVGEPPAQLGRRNRFRGGHNLFESRHT
jgi:hypothetical protein